MPRRIKNLRGTAGCRHYIDQGLDQIGGAHAMCSVNGCTDPATDACHVITAGARNIETTRRYIVYMCRSHNRTTGILEIGANRLMCEIIGCYCGTYP